MNHDELQVIISDLTVKLNLQEPQINEELLTDLSPEGHSELFQWLVAELEKENPSIKILHKKMDHLRRRLLKDKMNFAEGYEAFCASEQMWPGLLELKHSMTVRLRNILEFMYSYLPKQYCEFSDSQLNPIWLYPIFNDMAENITERVDEVYDGLAPVLQSMCAAIAWKKVQEDYNDGLVQKALERLERVSAMLTREHRWIYIAKILEDLLRSTFPSYAGRRDLEKQQALFQTMIGWTANALGGVQWNSDEIRYTFLPNLTGRVNRESWLSALYLADKIVELNHEFAKENSHLLREEVLREYPNYWTKEGKKGYYFSGAQSIALLEELADNLYVFHGSGALVYLNNVQNVCQAPKLWNLKNVHRYADYLEEIQLSFAHTLLLILVGQIVWEKEGGLPSEWCEIERKLLLLCKQLDDKHLLDAEVLIISQLLSRYGDLSWKYRGAKEALTNLMTIFTSPIYSVYLISSLGKDERDDLLRLLEHQIDKHLGELRSSERMELARILYVIDEFLLCLKVCDYIQYDKISTQGELELYCKVYVSAALSNLSFQNQQDEVEYLKRSMTVLDAYKQKYTYLQNEEILVLRGYVLGALFDRKGMDIGAFHNEYQSLVRVGRGGKLPAFIELMLLVRILNEKPDEKQTYLSKLENLIENIDGVEEIEGIRFLVQAWLCQVEGLYDEKMQYIEQAMQYRKQIEKALLLLPVPLRDYLPRNVGDADVDPSN